MKEERSAISSKHSCVSPDSCDLCIALMPVESSVKACSPQPFSDDHGTFLSCSPFDRKIAQKSRGACNYHIKHTYKQELSEGATKFTKKTVKKMEAEGAKWYEEFGEMYEQRHEKPPPCPR